MATKNRRERRIRKVRRQAKMAPQLEARCAALEDQRDHLVLQVEELTERLRMETARSDGFARDVLETSGCLENVLGQRDALSDRVRDLEAWLRGAVDAWKREQALRIEAEDKLAEHAVKIKELSKVRRRLQESREETRRVQRRLVDAQRSNSLA